VVSTASLQLPPSANLLEAEDPAPVMVHHHGRLRPAVVVCDHASNAIPARLGRLGLDDRALARHIAWDIGAGALANALARRLGLPCVLAGYSRLVIDCNREPFSEASVLSYSDGDIVPGNIERTPVDHALRVDEIFEPYHAAIDAELLASGSNAPVLIAVHSFTPSMNGFDRPWHCGVLWDHDSRLAAPLLAALRADAELVVGDNQPYSGRDPSDYTVSRHAKARGWPHVCIEVRQDLLADAAGVERWAERLGCALAPLLDDRTLYAPREAR
jgi:predicted N-formylglutamate amidohydrolase